MLKDAGMVEIARLEKTGCGTRKYYKSNTRVFSYELPDDAEERLAGASTQVHDVLSDLNEALLEEHGEEIESVASARLAK